MVNAAYSLQRHVPLVPLQELPRRLAEIRRGGVDDVARESGGDSSADDASMPLEAVTPLDAAAPSGESAGPPPTASWRPELLADDRALRSRKCDASPVVEPAILPIAEALVEPQSEQIHSLQNHVIMLAETQLFQGQALHNDIDTLRIEALKGIYNLEGQCRLFATAADVHARDTEIQRSYDEETLVARDNAEALFQRLRSHENFTRGVAEEVAALRSATDENATKHDLQQQVDNLQILEAGRTRADVGVRQFAKRIEERVEKAST